MRTVDEILDKIKQVKGLKTDTDLAGLFDVKSHTVSTWRTRGSIPYHQIVALCEREQVNLSWLLTGQINTKYINIDGVKVLTFADEPGVYKQDEKFQTAGGVSEGQRKFYINVREEIAEHNAGILNNLASAIGRIMDEGDYKKMSAIQSLIEVLDPKKEPDK